MKYTFYPYKRELNFLFQANTSRGALNKTKTCYYIKVVADNGEIAWGEASPFFKLSIDDYEDFEERLCEICRRLNEANVIGTWDNIWEIDFLRPYPSVIFALEMALLDLQNDLPPFQLFDTDFLKGSGIPINGLVWMGDYDFMKRQIQEKIDAGFEVIKLKIGALDFKKELSLLEYIRSDFSASNLIIRVDANGAFTKDDVFSKLKELSTYEIHSIEQPIKAGNWELMREVCSKTPIPVGLDEEIVGVNSRIEKIAILEATKPQYIVIKPTLVGGLKHTMEWISLAIEYGIGWWLTSALESNIALNAIAQLSTTYPVEIPHGLGTGKLYEGNILSPLTIEDGRMLYDKQVNWDNTGRMIALFSS